MSDYNYHKPTVLEINQWLMAGAAVLKLLEITDRTMTYKQFGQAIGIVGVDGWQPWHRRQVADVLYTLSAAEKQFAVEHPLAYQRVINQQKGKPGRGLYKRNKIVSTPIAVQ